MPVFRISSEPRQYLNPSFLKTDVIDGEVSVEFES
jgi:hypothetical protein